MLSFRARSFPAAGWKPIEQPVPITWTHCHFGGQRPWFICSARTNSRYCGGRVAVLYLAGGAFACRCCCGPAYASQQKDPLVRNMARALKRVTYKGADIFSPAGVLKFHEDYEIVEKCFGKEVFK